MNTDDGTPVVSFDQNTAVVHGMRLVFHKTERAPCSSCALDEGDHCPGDASVPSLEWERKDARNGVWKLANN